MKLAIAALIFVCPDSVFAQKVAVKIIQRQDRDTAYIFVVAGHSASRLYTDPNVNCHGLATATSINTVSYCVRGATFALQLPDGRVAIVNCFNKAFVFFPLQARSCRKPITDDVQAQQLRKAASHQAGHAESRS